MDERTIADGMSARRLAETSEQRADPHSAEFSSGTCCSLGLQRHAIADQASRLDRFPPDGSYARPEVAPSLGLSVAPGLHRDIFPCQHDLAGIRHPPGQLTVLR